MYRGIWFSHIIFLSVSLSSATLYGQETQAKDPLLWHQYKSNFLQEDGRIIDHYQGRCSHSEGQGYGMLLAVAFNDKPAFDKLWSWTKDNLHIRPDNLFAWKWGKRYNDRWEIIDYNNATDGDILISYALLKASERWREPKYKKEALKVIESIRKNSTVTWQGQTLLLPGHYGFIRDNGFIINPSYFIFSAFRYFSKVDDKGFWEKLYNDSLNLLTRASFGKLYLPADWIFLNGSQITIYKDKDPYFSTEAIRTILYVSSEEKPWYPHGVSKVLDMYKRLGYIPLWIDLERDSFSLTASPGGYYAVFGLAAKKLGDEKLSKQLFKDGREKLSGEGNDYYSFSLYLLSESGILP